MGACGFHNLSNFPESLTGKRFAGPVFSVESDFQISE